MKIILSRKTKCLFIIGIGFCLLIILLNVIGYIFNCTDNNIFVDVVEENKYEVRSKLLMEAMEHVGVCNMEDTAKIWANGLKIRSAALQYSVLSKELKEKYVKQLDESAPNWVTGMSSPWIESYQINRIYPSGKNLYSIKLTFLTATSTGPAGEYIAILTVYREGDFWRITKISMAQELYPYTGFMLEI